MDSGRGSDQGDMEREKGRKREQDCVRREGEWSGLK